MTPDQIRAAMGAIAEKLEGVVAGAEGYTDEQLAQIEAFDGEYEALDKQLVAAERTEKMKKATASAGRKTAPAAAAPIRVEVGASHTDKNHGFKSGGDWLMAVRQAGLTGTADSKLMNTAIFEKNGDEGGFLVPETISESILKQLEGGDASLMAKTTQIPVSGNSLTINVDETQPWNQGITCAWTAEGGLISESKPSFKQASWRVNKLAALVKATDEMLDDAVALEGYIKRAAPDAFVNKVNGAILSGNGSGKPQGIINSPFAVTVAEESMQTNDTVVAANVIKMYSRMFPQSLPKSAFYINPEVQEQLRLLQDPNGNYMYIAPGGFGSQINNSPYGTLLGRPVIPMMGSMPALGDVGDIIFADLSFYYTVLKSGGIKSATSIHLLFDREQTAFRFSMRLDGKCPFTAPVTTEFGSYDMSAIVLLEAR